MQKKQLIIALLAFSLLTIVYDFSISQKTGVSLLNHALAEEMDQSEMKSSNIDKPRGQLLYETHCDVCHNTSVHNRNPRKADSIGKIKYFVTRWSNELKLNWSSSDINEVAQYLNSKYYKYTQ